MRRSWKRGLVTLLAGQVWLTGHAALAGPAELAGQAVWEVEGASVTFEIRNAGFPVRGSFEGLEAEVCFDPSHPENGKLMGSIDPSTVDTGIGLRDRHLLKRDFFDVETYGSIDLASLRLRRESGDFAGTFLLRIRDVERELEIPFDFEESGANARLSGSLVLDRLDYDLGKPSFILGDDVRVDVVLDLVRRSGSSSPGPCG